MKHKTLVVSALSLCWFMLLATTAMAYIITDSSNFNVTLNDGAYIKQGAAPSSWFNQEIFTSGDETVSGTVAFSAIPYFSFSNTRYFQFVYDMQETGGKGQRQINIDDIVLTVGGFPIPFWNFDQTLYGSIILNTAEPWTNTPLGAGGDMELYVPVYLFQGYGLTGSNLLTLTVTQSMSDNGTDEWVVLGSAGGGSFFSPGDPINDPNHQAPLPPTAYLLGAGLLGLLAARRRSK